MNYIPIVIDDSERLERAYDIYSRLLKDRIVFICGEIDDLVANNVISELLYLDSLNHDDTMNYIKSDVSTICIGIAASMGALILSSGTRGKRMILKNADVMIHQVFGKSEGQASDIEISTKRILDLKNRLNKILAKNTGKSIKTIEKNTDRDNYLSASEAISYGIVDKIV